jgi:hypothetical protein
MPEREDPQAQYDKQQNELAQQQDERSKRLKIGKYTEKEEVQEQPSTEKQPSTEAKKSKAQSDKSE